MSYSNITNLNLVNQGTNGQLITNKERLNSNEISSNKFYKINSHSNGTGSNNNTDKADEERSSTRNFNNDYKSAVINKLTSKEHLSSNTRVSRKEILNSSNISTSKTKKSSVEKKVLTKQDSSLLNSILNSSKSTNNFNFGTHVNSKNISSLNQPSKGKNTDTPNSFLLNKNNLNVNFFQNILSGTNSLPSDYNRLTSKPDNPKVSILQQKFTSTASRIQNNSIQRQDSSSHKSGNYATKSNDRAKSALQERRK